MNHTFKTIASWTVLLLMLIQFIPMNRINPPVYSDIQAPDPVKKYLKKACYACHSNETEWAHIAYIAPASWLVSAKVTSGRNVLNFSIWNNKNNAENSRQKRKMSRIVLEGTSHQRLYYTLKPKAQLTEQESKVVLDWLNASSEKQSPGIKNSGQIRQDKTF
jgi:hypothetical protein